MSKFWALKFWGLTSKDYLDVLQAREVDRADDIGDVYASLLEDQAIAAEFFRFIES